MHGHSCPLHIKSTEILRNPGLRSSCSCKPFRNWETNPCFRNPRRPGFPLSSCPAGGQKNRFFSQVHVFETPQFTEVRNNGDPYSVSSAFDGFIGRRAALALLFFTFSEALQHKEAIAEDEKRQAPLNLEFYSDDMEGFTLMKPAQWNKIDKAGATVLFEDPLYKGNNVGVVVNPVRISSLREFGTLDVVADKLLQAEKKKPSTNDVKLIKVNERQVHGGVPLYQLEYKLDSSRGAKRILSAVTVASKKLYILNVAFTDSLEKPLPPDTALVLDQIVNSFDILN